MKVVAYVDGGCHPNPGGQMGIGVSVHEPGAGKTPGPRLAAVSEAPPGPGTNNVAEYLAVRRALEECKRLGAKEVLLRADSALMVNQLTGKFRIVNARLRELAKRINDLAEPFDRVVFEWVPREENTLADALATKAIRGALGQAPGGAASGTKYQPKASAAKPAGGAAKGPKREPLGSKATEGAAQRYDVAARSCPTCGTPSTFAWHKFADGSWHVKQTCPEHGYVRFTPNEEPFLTLAGKRPA